MQPESYEQNSLNSNHDLKSPQNEYSEVRQDIEDMQQELQETRSELGDMRSGLQQTRKDLQTSRQELRKRLDKLNGLKDGSSTNPVKDECEQK
ncbi:hypothetical protein [Leptolyngbya sp. FACHB-261]|uniref:hypothetical protein n=1 Tax=Leptolyngbya sp. FACHB-261 TaxID=2692806 RepID=UPI00168530A9|nr:hypothetical protein [Leptolyngbya sp. FACHB-261]MBD2099457.1 hypothetical protein [Leptolyngbya sp. FACHB-261]